MFKNCFENWRAGAYDKPRGAAGWRLRELSMPNIKDNVAAQQTRRRLVEAAGQVFARRGLHGATIKQITDKAQVNLAAVNYHFKDKFALYAAVIRHALSIKGSPLERIAPTGSPRRRMRSLIAGLIEDIYDPARPAWLTPLLAHEFTEPTEAITEVIDELLRPRADRVHGLVRFIVGPGASEQQVVRAAMSVLSQCFMILYNRQVLQRLYPELMGADQKRQIIDHITQFSMAGLESLRAVRRRGAK